MSSNTSVNIDRLTPTALHTCIQKVATGPEHSKNLSFEEARLGMASILSGAADPVQAAVFLIALRMKRETPDENTGVLQAILEHRIQITASTDEVVDVADPYNGQVRGLPVAPFIAPLLSACGVAAFSHGVESVGPKYGLTHNMILRAAGIDVDRTPQQVADQLADADIGWGYLDQKQYCPNLHALVPLRDKMVKRTVITTLEVLTRPISGKIQTHLLTGYVHKAYPPVYAELARFAGYDSAAIVRGVEGGVIPSLQQPAKYYRYAPGVKDEFIDIDPNLIGIDQPKRMVPLPDAKKSIQEEPAVIKAEYAKQAAALGLNALENKAGAARDSLLYSAAIVLLHLGKYPDLKTAAQVVDKVIASGDAHDKFTALRQ